MRWPPPPEGTRVYLVAFFDPLQGVLGFLPGD